MTISAQVIDTSVDPLSERRRKRQGFLRIGFPIAGVILLIAAILGIALYSERANRRDALALSQELLTALDDRIAHAVASYLDPAARAVAVARDVVREGSIMSRIPTIESVGSSLLLETPQLAILSFADEDGNYIMVRNGEAGGTDIKIIANDPGPRRVTWLHRNANGVESGRREDPDDKFDPRSRPWFTGAAESDGMFWTGVYIFFTDQRPGLTASTRFRAPDGRLQVVGADITLEDLSQFLASIEIGATGRAIIMDGSGKAIATPKGSDVVRKDASGELITAHVHELGDPALTAAYDRFRIEGHGRRVVEAGTRRYITAATPLPTAGRDWSVLVVVPEDELVGFVTINNRDALLMSAAVIAIAGLLAVLLVHQGLRADRTVRLLRDRQHAIDRQSEAFATLAADAELFDSSRHEPPRALTETLVKVTRTRRCSIWRLDQAGRVLCCEDSFERDGHGHVDGLELHQAELPSFFTHLLGGEELEVNNAAADRRTAEFERVVMRPLGTRSLFVVPVKHADRVAGAVALEDTPSLAEAREFVRAVAHMVALRIAEAPAATPAGGSAPDKPAIAAVPEAKRSYTAELASRGIDPSAIEGEVYSNVAIMVVHLVDPVALSIRAASAENSISDQIACTLQQIARKRDVPYLKIVGQDIIGAAGFNTQDTAAALLIAEVALAIRDHCLQLFEESDHRQEFRIGIDCGPAIGSEVGREPRLFNLWGEAVRSAGHMATTGLPGMVQVTEAAYQRLRHDFLFRPRGAFYLPQVGEARTFILVGRR